MKSLSEIQNWMQAVITDPNGVEVAIRELAADSDQPHELICSSEKLDGLARLSIYNRGYHSRLIECLKAEYPCLNFTLGDDLFKQFILGYLQHYPSTSYNLNELGKYLPDYLENTNPNNHKESIKENREHWADFVVDLARLERTYLEIYDAQGSEDEVSMGLESLLGMGQEKFLGLSLNFVRALTVLNLRSQVDQYFYQYRRSQQPDLPQTENRKVVVYRHDYIVRMLPVSKREHIFLEALRAGHIVSKALAETPEFSPSDARRSLLNWADQNMFLLREV